MGITSIEGDSRKPPSHSALSRLGAITGYLLVVAAPAVLATLVDEQLVANGMVNYGVAMFGMVAYAMISIQFVLAARFKWIGKPFGPRKILQFHKAMAVIATLLALVHLGLLLWLRGNWELVLDPMATWPIQLGRIAAVSLLLTFGYSFGRKWIPINNVDWRFFHAALAWVILVSGFVHGIVMGSSFRIPFLAGLWTGYFAIAIAAWAFRWSSRRNK